MTASDLFHRFGDYLLAVAAMAVVALPIANVAQALLS
jgi:hypothetical protein